MRKINILIILILAITLYSPATDAKIRKNKVKEPVKVEKTVTYTVESAKKTAFNGVSQNLPLSEYKSHLTDKLYSINMYHIKTNALCAENNSTPRSLFPSYCGNLFVSYGIRYHKKPDKVWVYSSAGKLLRFEIDNNMESDVFPRTSLTYNNKGILSGATFYVSKSDQYNFDGKGNLIVHWVGTKAYNRSGQLMRITRQL